MKIDLNADLGEGCANDAALLQLVSSANIACGFHAGDAQTMLASVREALKNDVAVGAHPSFPDRENFGRSAMTLPVDTVYAQIRQKLTGYADFLVCRERYARGLFAIPQGCIHYLYQFISWQPHKPRFLFCWTTGNRCRPVHSTGSLSYRH